MRSVLDTRTLPDSHGGRQLSGHPVTASDGALSGHRTSLLDSCAYSRDGWMRACTFGGKWQRWRWREPLWEGDCARVGVQQPQSCRNQNILLRSPHSPLMTGRMTSADACSLFDRIRSHWPMSLSLFSPRRISARTSHGRPCCHAIKVLCTCTRHSLIT